MSHDFPTPSEVVAIHTRLIEAFGGIRANLTNNTLKNM